MYSFCLVSKLCCEPLMASCYQPHFENNKEAEALPVKASEPCRWHFHDPGAWHSELLWQQAPFKTSFQRWLYPVSEACLSLSLRAYHVSACDWTLSQLKGTQPCSLLEKPLDGPIKQLPFPSLVILLISFMFLMPKLSISFTFAFNFLFQSWHSGSSGSVWSSHFKWQLCYEAPGN